MVWKCSKCASARNTLNSWSGPTAWRPPAPYTLLVSTEPVVDRRLKPYCKHTHKKFIFREIMQMKMIYIYKQTHIVNHLCGEFFFKEMYEHQGDLNHWQPDCLFNNLFKLTAKKQLITGPLRGNPPVTDGFPTQRACNAESVCLSWHYHIDGLVEDCSNSTVNARSYCSVTLSHWYYSEMKQHLPRNIPKVRN